MRKLASIQRILDISPIEGADRIEVCRVLGWQCVIGKNDFKVGDLIIFLEVDSVTSQTETFKLLKDSGYRVKTRRFKKQVSQGLCLPLSILEGLCLCKELPLEGDDVTELLGITKYDPYVPAQLAGLAKGNFPEFLHKTDETRIQAVPAVLYRHQNKKFYVTEKVDGSSMTVYFRRNEHFADGEFGVCSRNIDMKEEGGTSFWKVARELDLENKLRSLNRNIALQGELLGPGVQGNKYKLEKLGYYIFNVFDIDSGLHLDFEQFIKMVDYLDLTHVPVVNAEYILPNTVDGLVEFSKGKSLLNKDSHREGVVFRPHVNEYDEDLHGRLSFKCINPDFLLKYDSE